MTMFSCPGCGGDLNCGCPAKIVDPYVQPMCRCVVVEVRKPLIMPEQVPDKMVQELQDAIEGECGGTAITRQQARNVLSYILTNMVRNGGSVGNHG